MADGGTSWDEGLTRDTGLLISHRKDRKPPAYYAEGNFLVQYAKTFGFAFVAILPYFTVLDQLGSIQPEEFQPCTNSSCHYMRLFDSSAIPGSGSDIMSVRNGVARPFHLDFQNFEVQTCMHREKGTKPRDFQTKMWEATCPPADGSELREFLESHKYTNSQLEFEQNAAEDFTASVRIALWVTKVPLWAFTSPFTLIGKSNDHWGMENIPSGRCPGMNEDEMAATCRKPSIRKKVDNHLAVWGPAKITTLLSLFCWACLSGIHDLMLLRGWSEVTTLKVGIASTVLLGGAVAAVFIWAMGSTEVFAAEVLDRKGDDPIECLCYYQLPELRVLFGLITPFMLLATFAAKVQIVGMACLYGDFLYYQMYTVPQYLAKQSFLWSWATLVTPKMAGTTKATPREEFTHQQWRGLFQWQQGLFYWRFVVINGFVALSAAAYMVAFKQLIYFFLLNGLDGSGQNTFAVHCVLKFVLLPGPSVVTWGAGLFAIMELYQTCIDQGEGESFADQIGAATPEWVFGEKRIQALKLKAGLEKNLGRASFAIGLTVILAWTAATAQGLCPDMNLLLGNEELTKPSLAQAELWGACGFIFMGFHIQRGISFVFSTWDDLESLKTLGTPKQERSEQGQEMPDSMSDSTTALIAPQP